MPGLTNPVMGVLSNRVIEGAVVALGRSSVHEALNEWLKSTKRGPLNHDMVEKVLHKTEDDPAKSYTFYSWASSQPGYSHSPQTLNRLLKTYLRTPGWSKQTMELLAMEQCVSNLSTYNMVIPKMLKQVEAPEIGLQAVAMMKSKGLKVQLDTFKRALKAVQGSFQGLGARPIVSSKELVELYKHTDGDQETWDLVEPLLAADKTLGLLDTTELLRQLTYSQSGIPDVWKFIEPLLTANLKSYGYFPSEKRVEVHEALKNLMENDLLSYSQCIKLLEDLPNDSAVSLFLHLWEDVNGFAAATRTKERLDKLIMECLRREYNPDAERLFHMMVVDLQLPPSTQVFHELVGLMCEYHSEVSAENLIDLVLTHNVMPPLDAYKRMILAFLDSYKREQAVELYKRMRSQGVEPDSELLHAVFRELIQARNYDQVVELYTESSECMAMDSVDAYVYVVVSMLNEGMPSEAAHLWSQCRIHFPTEDRSKCWEKVRPWCFQELQEIMEEFVKFHV